MIDDKKTIRAWAMYDWANSAYNLIITSAIFPSYFMGIVPSKVPIGNFLIANESIASWSISLAFLIIAIISPMLSAIADYNGNKKLFMKIFCTIGAVACMLLFFFKKNNEGVNIWYGVTFSIIACFGFCGSLVFYNAYLPEIASKENQDKVSAKGFVMGYIGSVSLLIICLAIIMGFAAYNKAHDQILVRLSFILVGVWWLGWSQIPFKVLKDGVKKINPNNINIFKAGYQTLGVVWQEIKIHPIIKRYLTSYFFINMGVQTIMYIAANFAAKELHLETAQLIITILIIQIVAIGGAYIFAKITDIIGIKFSLAILLLIWIGVCASAAFVVYKPFQFYILAFFVGLIMGGTQSLTRSTYSKLIPAESNNNASYFSFFDVVDKMATVIGTLTFGLVSNITGMRMGAFALSIYFIIGLMVLLTVRFNFKKQ